jgi:hypothetical protein
MEQPCLSFDCRPSTEELPPTAPRDEVPSEREEEYSTVVSTTEEKPAEEKTAKPKETHQKDYDWMQRLSVDAVPRLLNALTILGNGFLDDEMGNVELCESIRNKTLTVPGYYRQVLRLAYRLQFLMLIEERNLLHAPEVEENERYGYKRFFGVRRFIDAEAVERERNARGVDLWERMKIVWRGLAECDEKIGLSALGGPFDPKWCPILDRSRLANSVLIDAVKELGYVLRIERTEVVTPELFGFIYEQTMNWYVSIMKQTESGEVKVDGYIAGDLSINNDPHNQ